MPTIDLPPAQRLDALRDFLSQAEHPAKAREFVLGLLDPEHDADLLDYLYETRHGQPGQPDGHPITMHP